MTDTRKIMCAACGGDKGHHDPAGRWFECIPCAGEGEYEAEVEPVTMEDLKCPCGWDCTNDPAGPRLDCPYAPFLQKKSASL
ncbi:hypothetical protein [Bradyrhizobium sp. JR7.2]|uniref:hypothetical protein n=1 Tax=Bradyrhizobium sp. JR7.2 TaxID=3156375 RepID=UPI003396156A